jgi:DNA-binding Lrp family transcriptional regulator
VNGKNEKITMSKTALGRKIAEQRADGIKAYTVVVDRRTGGLTGKATYYVKEGLGSFRLGSMEKISLSDLRERVKP